jgi:large subunit ribosomal protein L4e
MDIALFDQTGKQTGKAVLPLQFSEPIRADLVKKAVLVAQANARQRYGAKKDAGLRQVGELSRKRHDYKTSYGHGISRVPRKILTRRGTRFYWVGAVAPGTVGGRRAHPPKSSKIWKRKLNKNERRKALRSALSATVIKDHVQARGHLVPENYPFALASGVESIEKTKDVIALFSKLGLENELGRVAVRKVRAGRGTMRGRKYIKKKGPLVVVGNTCALLQSARNVHGVEVVPVKQLNVKLLAPGTDVGRLTLFTQSALEALTKEKLFM